MVLVDGEERSDHGRWRNEVDHVSTIKTLDQHRGCLALGVTPPGSGAVGKGSQKGYILHLLYCQRFWGGFYKSMKAEDLDFISERREGKTKGTMSFLSVADLFGVKGRVALVTGGCSGIGLMIAKVPRRAFH